MATSRRYLMCEPRYFAVQYAINPWMDPRFRSTPRSPSASGAVSPTPTVALGHDVSQIEPVDGLPDMVFAANGATVANNRVYGAKFRTRSARLRARPT